MSVDTVRYIRIDDSLEYNCDAMHQVGAEGTIVKLPEGCGFGTYGVISATRSLSNLTVDHELRQRTPSPNPPVHEMDITYDYSLVKRDSGTVYVRVGYWNDIVLVDAVTKGGINESVERRFWSSDASNWKTEFDAIRDLGLPNAYTLNLEQDDIYQLLYSQDESGSCGGEDGWLNIELEGSVQSALRWRVTMVWTISPEISFEEAYGFFDVDMTMVGTIMLDGKASINLAGSTKPAWVFDTDISNFAFSEPGIVSFTPKMNILASMTGQGTIDSDFRLGFRAGTDGYARTNAHLSLDSGNTISVIGGDQQVGVEAYSSSISVKWEDDDTSHLVGSIGTPYMFTNSTSNDALLGCAPNWRTNAAISGDYIGCSGNILTQTGLSTATPASLIGDGSEISKIQFHQIRNTISSYRAPRNFNVQAPSGTTWIITSHKYPNQQGGAFLLSKNPDAGYYWLENPEDCDGIDFTPSGDPDGASWATEHIVELSTFKMILEWMMGDPFTDINSSNLRTSLTPVDEALLNPRRSFQRPWEHWSGTISGSSPIDDIWRAFGDDTNPSVLVNAEKVFNGIKLQIWQGNNAMADDKWKEKGLDDTSEETGKLAAEKGMSTIRAATALFSYLNSLRVHANMVTILNSIHTIFEDFDTAINAERDEDDEIHTATLFSEFVYYALIPRIEGVQDWIERRIGAMITAWTAVFLESLRGLLAKAETAVLLDIGGFDFDAPELPSEE
ncbi:hypothetical protein OCU04_010007 [Sclerotinia nivalis]|uniref:Uncharacterized protein n=1 Tax=Sclerotinia nivalis TaxID=352851 RepID=A0A9X0ADM8_9HELO|nr:hypothetical protein OCU04_010007 [Sclerotinia nivalis]